MAFREVSVNEIREVLRVWLGVAGLPAPGYRRIAAHCGVDRKTVRRYVEAAQAAGLRRSDSVEAVDDGLIGVVADAVRPVRPDGHGAAWEQLTGFEEQITAWVAGDGEQRPLTITKIHTLLARQGCAVPYRTLNRFAGERCGFGHTDTTVRVADGDPGVECQIDFGYLGMLTDAEDGRRRKVHALIFTAVYSRHMFVWLSYSQTLAAVIAGCQAAWDFFGGVFAVLIPDNLKPVIAAADAVNPRFTQGWLDYAGHVGFLTDPARVRSPKDKPLGCILHLFGLNACDVSYWCWSPRLGGSAGSWWLWWVVGVGSLVEHLAFVVVAQATDNSGAAPGFDGVAADAELRGHLGEGAHAGVAQALAPACEPVGADDVVDDLAVERFVLFRW